LLFCLVVDGGSCALIRGEGGAVGSFPGEVRIGAIVSAQVDITAGQKVFFTCYVLVTPQLPYLGGNCLQRCARMCAKINAI